MSNTRRVPLLALRFEKMEGKIAYIDIHDITKQPPTDKIFEALKKLK